MQCLTLLRTKYFVFVSEACVLSCQPPFLVWLGLVCIGCFLLVWYCLAWFVRLPAPDLSDIGFGFNSLKMINRSPLTNCSSDELYSSGSIIQRYLCDSSCEHLGCQVCRYTSRASIPAL